MSKINDGGAAFPFTPNPQPFNPLNNTWTQEWDEGASGMSLRDWFAGMAMQAIATSVNRWGESRPGVDVHEVIASGAYNIADAMIAEKEETDE